MNPCMRDYKDGVSCEFCSTGGCFERICFVALWILPLVVAQTSSVDSLALINQVTVLTLGFMGRWAWLQPDRH